MSAQISEADYDHMSWHARQRLNERLKRETRTLSSEIETLVKRRYAVITPTPETTIRDAKSCLATLPPDPDSAAHRFALAQELKQPRGDAA